MAEFDDIVERRGAERENQEPSPKSRPAPPPEPGIGLIDLLNDEKSLGGFANQLNPDLKSKVLLPLANLLDKYGVSQNVASSPTTQNTLGLVSLMTDIAPVVKGLADYISGQQNKLADEDKAFLDEIKKAQESGEMADLFGGEEMMNMGDDVEDAPPEPPKNVHPILGQMGEVKYNVDGTVDWTASIDPDGEMREKARKMAMGITPEYEKQMEQMGLQGLGAVQGLGELKLENVNNEVLSMPSLEELAMSAGLTMEKVHDSSSEIKSNNQPVDTTVSNLQEPVNLLNDSIIDDMLEMESQDEDEIIYLTEMEVEELEAQGFEMESLDDDSEEE
tara:strand:+ start:1657 stop:2655 length:999 start_codon:yes stop_codon:yes gene_type:complete